MELKTLWTLLQEVVESEEKWYSLYEFLEEENRLRFKDVKDKLIKANQKQFYEFMDWFTFVNETEVNNAVWEYFEIVNNRPVSMWELGDLSEVADDYIRNRNLNFDED